jgi:hypothetical protein
VLEAFASESVAADILVHALVDGGFETLPERADDLDDLVQGALRAEVSAVLGEDVAQAVVEGMEPVVAMMRRAETTTPLPLRPARERPSLPSSERETAVPPPPSPRRDPEVDGRPAPDTRPAPAEPMIPVEMTATTLRPPRVGQSSGTDRPASRSETASASMTGASESIGGRQRPPTFAGAIELALLTGDEELVELVRAHAAAHSVLVAETLSALRKARVVVVDTRHAFDALATTWSVGIAPQVAILWPADLRDRTRFEALQPHVPRVVCVGEEATREDLALLVELQLRAR